VTYRPTPHALCTVRGRARAHALSGTPCSIAQRLTHSVLFAAAHAHARIRAQALSVDAPRRSVTAAHTTDGGDPADPSFKRSPDAGQMSSWFKDLAWSDIDDYVADASEAVQQLSAALRNASLGGGGGGGGGADVEGPGGKRQQAPTLLGGTDYVALLQRARTALHTAMHVSTSTLCEYFNRVLQHFASTSTEYFNTSRVLQQSTSTLREYFNRVLQHF
jgi:hypothetical protein